MAGSKLGAVNNFLRRRGRYRRKRVIHDGLTSTGDAPTRMSPRLSRRTQRGIVFPEINPKTYKHSKTTTYLNNGFTSVGVERVGRPAIADSIYSGKGNGSSRLPELNRTVGYGTTSGLSGDIGGEDSYALLRDYPEGRATRDIHIHLHPGRELRHMVDRRLKDESLVYHRPPPKLPPLNQLTLQTHRLRYTANADYKFKVRDARRDAHKEADERPCTIRLCPSETISRLSSFTLLPVLETPRGRLRRPTLPVPRPLRQSKENVVALAENAMLSPIITERYIEQGPLFYTKHFPLVFRPDIKDCGEFSRRRERILKRIGQMDKHIDDLTTEETFTTELKSDTFNPVTWDWNKS